MAALFLPLFSSLLSIAAFNMDWHFLTLVALAPLFIFYISERSVWKLLAGTAIFRLIFALGTVYFVIDPILYFLSILIFLGLPLSFYLARERISPLAAEAALPFLWTLWDYLEAQYTLLPMTLMMFGIPLADSAFLGLASFGGVLGLTFFAALINLVIAFLVLERHSDKGLFLLSGSLIVLLLAGYFRSAEQLAQNKNNYYSKDKFLELEILSATKVKAQTDNLVNSLSVERDADLLILPENLYRSKADNWDELVKFYQKIAKTVGIPTSAVTLRRDGEKIYKTNLVFSSQGEVLDMYDKTRLTITSEYWPLGRWRPFYFQPQLDRHSGAGKAIFDPAYQHERGKEKILDLGNFSFAAPICVEFHYPAYLNSLNKFNPDFIAHNSNNDWIDFGLGQYLSLTNKLRKIEAVHFKKPVVVNGIKDFAGVFYPDGTSELVYPKNGFSLVNAEIRF